MPTTHRTLSALCALALATSTMLPTAFAQDSGVGLTLEPHCTNKDRTDCPFFETADAASLETGLLNTGDILDIDVIVIGATGNEVTTIHSWLQYDPKILEARSVELTGAISQPSPGEQTIQKSTGLVKIGGSTSNLQGDRIAIARVTFRVIKTGANTVISFDGFNPNGTGHTAVNGPVQSNETENRGLAEPPCLSAILGCGGTPTPLLQIDPSTLTVVLADPQDNTAGSLHAAVTDTGNGSSAGAVAGVSPGELPVPPPTTSSSSSSLSSSAATSAAAPKTENGSSAFILLQVQNVRVTTRDGQIFLGWDPLNSSELAGYNVYYGTVSGKYIQRRSIPSSASSLVLRDLENGIPYFLAVRAYNTSDQESVFSKEVSVTVGKPETSSSPLVANIEDTSTIVSPPVTENPIETYNGDEVTGTTGMSDTLLLFAIVSACIGTGFAFARQLSIQKLTHVA